jgi:SAM-dependent methyltransferase
METLIELFNFGMERNYDDIIPDFDPKVYHVLNLGPGHKGIKHTIPLEWPDWDAEVDAIPFPTRTIAQIHCYHFLEHIQNIVPLIIDMRRVLIPGGHINIVVPYYIGSMAFADADHKRFFSEKVWRNMFSNEHYEKHKVPFMEIVTNMIMGDRLENLCLVTQLRKPMI